MKKLFISVPMRNRTEYAIKASMEQMHKIAEAVFGISARASRNCPKQTASSAFTMRTRATVVVSSRISLQRTIVSRPTW